MPSEEELRKRRRRLAKQLQEAKVQVVKIEKAKVEEKVVIGKEYQVRTLPSGHRIVQKKEKPIVVEKPVVEEVTEKPIVSHVSKVSGRVTALIKEFEKVQERTITDEEKAKQRERIENQLLKLIPKSELERLVKEERAERLGKAAKVVLRGGALVSVTKPRKKEVVRKLAVITTPKAWGEAPTEVRETWGTAKSTVTTWGEKAKAPAVTVVRKRKEEVKVEVRPAKARLTPWEKTYPITRKIPTVHRRRAAEQPRDARGRFARKVVSEYDLAPRDFFLRQQEKLDRGEITPASYARYVHRYEERHPDRKFRGKRYRLTCQVTGVNIKDNEELTWRVTLESHGIQLTPAMQKDLMERVKLHGESTPEIKVVSVVLWAVYDRLTGKRIKGGGAF